MHFTLPDAVLKHIEESQEETLRLFETLCRIPAPSHHEEQRAEFCKNWLEEQGAKGVYIDSALNVLYPVNCEDRDDIILFMAHTDTVFPDTEPMPFSRDEKNFYSPGAGDDTICLTILLMAAKYITQNHIKPPRGILFAANSCEEGLGNLKGIKQIMKDYEGRIKEVYTFDGQYNRVVTRCVGSHRYRITFKTMGGHSFNAFGAPNAIHAASKLICRLYDCQVPTNGDSRTTFNVGVIEGGTSVNTIAQSAGFMYEYRSDDQLCLQKMKEFFEKEIELAKSSGDAEIEVETIGIRPCGGDVDQAVLEDMAQKCIRICEKYSGIPCKTASGSTDSNIPQSLGVPSVCTGSYTGGGAHTREEYVEAASIPIGMRIAFELILSYCEQ